MRLRSDNKLRGDIFELVHARDQRSTYGSRSDHVTAILDAFEAHLTQAGPGSDAVELLRQIREDASHCPFCMRVECAADCKLLAVLRLPAATPQAGHRGTPGEA